MRYLNMRLIGVPACALLLAIGSIGIGSAIADDPREGDYENFESPQVHPLALTPDGTRLLVLNTPNHRLVVLSLEGPTPVLEIEIPVGLEPVSVRARNNREVWVANWLSDSVSIVDLETLDVVQTLDVGDEPTDVLFAGPDRERAFICVSGLASSTTVRLTRCSIFSASRFSPLKATTIGAMWPNL
jgi:YVTN family beta-propeller protein